LSEAPAAGFFFWSADGGVGGGGRGGETACADGTGGLPGAEAVILAGGVETLADAGLGAAAEAAGLAEDATEGRDEDCWAGGLCCGWEVAPPA